MPRIGMIVLLSVSLISCGHRYIQDSTLDSDAIQNMSKVVVLPFENLTDYENAGVLLADIFANELIGAGKLEVYERPKVEEFLTLRNIRFPKVVDRSFARQLAKIMEVDGVFYGSVTEYTYRLNNPLNKQEEPSVGINLRLLDVNSGRIVWVSSRASSSFKVFALSRDPLTRVATEISQQMVNSLYKGSLFRN